jgi:hypothetical protein
MYATDLMKNKINFQNCVKKQTNKQKKNYATKLFVTFIIAKFTYR